MMAYEWNKVRRKNKIMIFHSKIIRQNHFNSTNPDHFVEVRGGKVRQGLSKVLATRLQLGTTTKKPTYMSYLSAIYIMCSIVNYNFL